ncbi:MAG: bifunctional riboflavin kinase/FAD synthetase [Bacteroidia bacterium]|jgi:riboflavin kinase/FMN adenylyltransferase|nr:bifunctional riboflavin kinase/FAD synthetase [Bacteroidia bacterium]
MKVYRSFDTFKPVQSAIVTQGTFDGVHVAHQVILNRVKELANVHHGESVLMTFDPHPRTILFPDDHGLKLLHTLDEKIEALDAAGIDHLIVIPFTKSFSRMTSAQFISDILVRTIGTHTLVIGYDHRFGKNREGTFAHLSQYAGTYGFAVEEIPEQDINHVAVSSTRIRQALEAGDVKTAATYLGRNYQFRGVVVQGKQLGRTIGFPTANIQLDHPLKQMPLQGVYAVKVIINSKSHFGMLNAGMRPTVDGASYAIEVHLFDFNQDLYGQTIQVEFIDRLRNEQKFNGIAELQNQLEKDKLHALSIIKQAH